MTSREYVKTFSVRVAEFGGRMVGFGHDNRPASAESWWAMAVIGIPAEDLSDLVWDCWFSDHWNSGDYDEAAQFLMDIGECSARQLERSAIEDGCDLHA